MSLSKPTRFNLEENKKIQDRALELGVKVTLIKSSVKRVLHDLDDSLHEALCEAQLFKSKIPAKKLAERLEKVLTGYSRGPETIEGRIEAMKENIERGQKFGLSQLAQNSDNSETAKTHKNDFLVKRKSALRTTHNLQSTDEVMLTALASVEWKIKEVERSDKALSNIRELEKLDILLTMQQKIMKQLGIAKIDRDKHKGSNDARHNWESVVRSFNENREQKYDDAEEELLQDTKLMREAVIRHQKEIEGMFFKDGTDGKGIH